MPYHLCSCAWEYAQGADSIWRCNLTTIGNPTVEIRRSYDHLISTMGFPILVRWHLYIESGLRLGSHVLMIFVLCIGGLVGTNITYIYGTLLVLSMHFSQWWPSLLLQWDIYTMSHMQMVMSYLIWCGYRWGPDLIDVILPAEGISLQR